MSRCPFCQREISPCQDKLYIGDDNLTLYECDVCRRLMRVHGQQFVSPFVFAVDQSGEYVKLEF